MTPIYIQAITLPPVNEKEVLRYAACKSADESTLKLLYSCVQEANSCLQTKVCFRIANKQETENGVLFEHFAVNSLDLKKNLAVCKKVLLFAATLGTQLDRLIAKYGYLSPSRALMLQALGAERIEALCDSFCRWFCSSFSVSLNQRFSPGYGDLNLNVQNDLFNLLDCSKNIGLYLTNSLVMTPSKSVTAFAGLGKSCAPHNKCSLCKKADCVFRRQL